MYMLHVYMYSYTCLHTYIRTFHTYIRAFIHTYVHSYIRTYIRTYTHVHTYIHPYIHPCRHTYTHTYIHTYIHTALYVYVCLGFTTAGASLASRCFWGFQDVSDSKPCNALETRAGAKSLNPKPSPKPEIPTVGPCVLAARMSGRRSLLTSASKRRC